VTYPSSRILQGRTEVEIVLAVLELERNDMDDHPKGRVRNRKSYYCLQTDYIRECCQICGTTNATQHVVKHFGTQQYLEVETA
jgi:hypothetical protein